MGVKSLGQGIAPKPHSSRSFAFHSTTPFRQSFLFLQPKIKHTQERGRLEF